jgi:hypothetical protein
VDHRYGFVGRRALTRPELARTAGQMRTVRSQTSMRGAKAVTQTLRPLVVGKGSADNIAISPNGRWMAYTIRGRQGIWGLRHVVPRWRLDPTRPRVGLGWSLAGLETDGSCSTRVGTSSWWLTYPPGRRSHPELHALLFAVTGYRSATNRPQYDVTPDGRRFSDDSGRRRGGASADLLRGELVHGTALKNEEMTGRLMNCIGGLCGSSISPTIACEQCLPKCLPNRLQYPGRMPVW